MMIISIVVMDIFLPFGCYQHRTRQDRLGCFFEQKKTPSQSEGLNNLVAGVGFEPTTFRL